MDSDSIQLKADDDAQIFPTPLAMLIPNIYKAFSALLRHVDSGSLLAMHRIHLESRMTCLVKGDVREVEMGCRTQCVRPHLKKWRKRLDTQSNTTTGSMIRTQKTSILQPPFVPEEWFYIVSIHYQHLPNRIRRHS